MSAASRYPDLAGLRMSAEEYLALGEVPGRFELIDGVVQMSPSPNPWHQLIQRKLSAQMDAAAERMPGLVAIPDVDLQIGKRLVYEPDYVVYAPGRMTEMPARFTTPPDLVIDILSPGTRAKDLVTKRGDYEQFGIGEYWVIDGDDGSIRCWRRSGGGLIEHAVTGDHLECAAVTGLAIDLRPIRAARGG